MKAKIIGVIAFIIILPFSIRYLSFNWCARLSNEFYVTNNTSFESMNNGINYWLKKEMGRENFKTGSDRFNGEWLFGTYLMTAIGKCQYALNFPEKAPLLKADIEKALLIIQETDLKQFDIEAWGDDPFAFNNNDHGAYLGYYNLALSLYSFTCNRLKLEQNHKLQTLNFNTSNFLANRLKQAKNSMLQSYPDEYYSVDNCAIIASINLFDQANNNPLREINKKWREDFKAICLDKTSGTLIQALNKNGEVVDPARASGTFLGIFFLSFTDRELAKEIYFNAKKEYLTSILGFGAVKEHQAGTTVTNGDIDSGPVVFNLGLSPIGFMLGCARIFEDEESFSKLYATCFLGGAPLSGEKWNWKTAGPVGDTILFSMLTSLQSKEWKKYEN